MLMVMLTGGVFHGADEDGSDRAHKETKSWYLPCSRHLRRGH